MKLAGFIGPSYTLEASSYESQRTINYYLLTDELGTGKEQEPRALVPCPGQIFVHWLPKPPIRGVWLTANGKIVAVAGNGVYYLTTTDGVNYKHQLFGYLTTTTGPVSIIDGVPNNYNGVANVGLINVVVIVDGSQYGLAFQEGTTNTIQLNSGGSFTGSNYVTFQDGFFIFNSPGTPVTFFTDDPLNISTLDENTLNLGSDIVTRAIADHDVIWVFGKRSSSVWQNTGGSGSTNVFQEIPGSYAEAGCHAPGTVAKVSGQLLWVSNDDRGNNQVFLAAGYRGSRVSNHAVEQWLANVGDTSAATAWTYQDRGHSFYVLQVPGASTTWAYDLSNQTWNERGFWSNGEWGQDLVGTHLFFNVPGVGGVHLCGDYTNGNLYTLSDTVYLQNGQPMQRMRTTPHQSDAYKRIFTSEVQVDLEMGVGLDGNGVAIQQGFTGAPVLQTANATPLQGNGPCYSTVGNDHTVQTPLATPTITASGAWSNSFVWVGDQILINGINWSLPLAQFGVGNGYSKIFSFPSIPAGASFLYSSIYANDWRGNNLQSFTPLYNNCIYSQDFNQPTAWSFTGCSVVPSAWASILTEKAIANRPATFTDGSANGGTVLNGGNAFDLGASLAIKSNGGTYTLGTSTTGFPAVADALYSNFPSGKNQDGTLYIAVDSNANSNLSYITVNYSLDGGTTYINGWTTNTTPPAGTNFIGYGKPFYSWLPITKDFTGIDLSLLRISVLTGGSVASSFKLYDVVFIEKSITYGDTIDAPDTTNTGSLLTEDESSGFHQIETTYPAVSGDPVTASCYGLLEDPNRNLSLTVQGKTCEFVGSITGTTLTVLSIGSGSLEAGQYLSGNGIYPFTTISSGSGTTWSITPGVAIAVSNISISAVDYEAWAVFDLAGGYNVIVGDADCEPGPNGSFRCSVFGTEISTRTNKASARLYNINNTNDNYPGDGVGCIGIWGFQVEPSGSANPYLETQGTIAKDFVTVDLTFGIVTFNIAPLSAATLTATVTIYGSSPTPVEFYATFNYDEPLPNIVRIGTDPEIRLSYSKDGAHTWSTDRAVKLGKLGKYSTRAIWRRVGHARDMVYRLTTSEPCKIDLIGAEIRVKEGETNK